MSTLYGGIDLHSTNSYCGVIDEKGQWISHRRIRNNIDEITHFFSTYKEQLAGIVVEATYNGYWLMDGLKEAGYIVKLGNTSRMGNYAGLKDQNDKTDTKWLAEMFRLGILPESYKYPKEERPMRDLMRKRMLFINARTKILNSIGNQFQASLCTKIGKRQLLELSSEELYQLFEDNNLCIAARSGIEIIKTIDEQIKIVEKKVYEQVKESAIVVQLRTLPGIDKILGMTIALEIGEIDRFASDKHYLSYCRLVEAKRISNEKMKGKGNGKCGNTMLRWAYAEAAIGALRYPRIKAYYERLKKKKPAPKVLAIIASKIARVSYKAMKDSNFCYQEERLFQ